ncbi:MAG: hypothetical protein CBB97_07065 [Candidatus Endolissoclinum sp. TMED37]|nr:MAG: hypothetical protein CBB97_07065 [Candidatus Endolissoclinum sp. TMED37]
MKKLQIKKIVKNVLSETNGYDDDEMFPEEIRQFMSDEEKEEFLDDEADDNERLGSYTLDDIVDTGVLKTETPAGTKGWIDKTLRTLRDLMTNDELSEALMDIKEAQKTFDEFSETRDMAIDAMVKSPVGKEIGLANLPELSEPAFMNGYLYDFWFMATYIKPMERQADKGKDLTAQLKSVKDRWKYMNQRIRAEQFVSKVIVPVLLQLTRDTSVAG